MTRALDRTVVIGIEIGTEIGTEAEIEIGTEIEIGIEETVITLSSIAPALVVSAN